MTSDVKMFYEGLLEDYLNHIRREWDVETVPDYLERVDAFDNRTEVNEHTGLLQKFDLDVFFRCYPENGQQIMLAPINPGMRSFKRSHWRNNNEYYRHQKSGDDPSRIAQSIANNFQGYLTNDSNHFDTLIKSLQDILPSLPTTADVSYYEYIQKPRSDAYRANPKSTGQVDPTKGFFGDIFFSNAFKCATPKAKYLTGADWNFAKERFREEVFEVVNPDLVIATGSLPWKALYDAVEDTDIETYNDSYMTSSYQSRKQGGAPGGLYYFESHDLYVITTFHPGFYIKKQRFRDNLRKLVDKLN